MWAVAQLEEQLNDLDALNRASAKAIDSFADTSSAISARANEIIRDVKPWDVAQENITLTIEEMAKAARCYHPPPILPAVLTGKESSWEAIARCMDYLVYADDYLASHPPNHYGTEIEARTEMQLQQIVRISEDFVKSAFINAVQRSKVSPSGASADGSTGQAGGSLSVAPRMDSALTAPTANRLIRNEAALQGVDQIVQRLGENFNRTDILRKDVRKLLEEKLVRAVQAQFDGAYRDEETGRGPLTSRSSLLPVLKHYQHGHHPLLRVSKSARELVTDACACLQRYVLTPLEDDYAVADIPSELATVVFELVYRRAIKVIQLDTSFFADPTKLFVDSRGQGIGLFSTPRYFRDYIFIGLDFMEEFWKWKMLSKSIPGENRDFIDHVDDSVDNFIYRIRELLDGYVNAKGALEKESLKEYARSMRRTEWFPSVDCTVHESTTNVLYFHKTLLTSFYGSLRIVLYGSVIGANADYESCQEVEDYITRGVMGAVDDLQVLAEAAAELQQEALAKRNHHTKSNSLNLLTSDVRLSVDIFMINNLCFLEDNYRREACFTTRLAATEPPPKSSCEGASARKDTAAPPPPDPPLSQLFDMLNSERERYVEAFGASWHKCFPSIKGQSDLLSIEPNSTMELRKSQRMAVKQWHRRVNDALLKKIYYCKAEAVMDAKSRTQLFDVSVAAVRDGFERMEVLLNGRTWSSQPQKWMSFTPTEWEDQIRQAF
ncbi:conserved hypothetical protein [Leishmania major strain Friedlin]|uniref:Uncharacterized protein n=1 Tax=Leishmania major TaxID=5664 RepID=E9AFY5_LEIMA|nr:conserved hypothetical protein [Leishmania major strain Friedlin]CAG9582868.1 hypothetical_protein_-_conserved [Leishmania major strain Friedlin]CBZ13140.1 conserved hypothetical protein [Leishmania major strain Friedlin]|eukprot:XP_003722905.1 conserved hypothetical protein [Leishmania major strain Friedlin]